MHRSSETIGAIATALAKAQAELTNPEKTLIATIAGPNGERTFRYASLASGLDLVRKCLGQHEIAIMQTTAVDQSQIMLTTLLVHASGEWVSSLWPVCSATQASVHVKGAALTYARRYALFALVGIAGEDDLDAPELPSQPEQLRPEPSSSRKASNGSVQSSRLPLLAADQSAQLRERMLQEISSSGSDEDLALWAHRSLPLKNTLTQEDSWTVEAAYLAKLTSCAEQQPAGIDPPHSAEEQDSKSDHNEPLPVLDTQVTPLTKPVGKRSKARLAFVASQPCLICKSSPCDPHHLKIAQPRRLGRKVSDEFTVPLCRKHHQELHRHGNEANWWTSMQLAPIPIAEELWETSPVQGVSKSAALRNLPPNLL